MDRYRQFHRASLTDREAFWREEAALVDWQAAFDRVLDYAKPPFARRTCALTHAPSGPARNATTPAMSSG